MTGLGAGAGLLLSGRPLDAAGAALAGLAGPAATAAARLSASPWLERWAAEGPAERKALTEWLIRAWERRGAEAAAAAGGSRQ